ncbi:Crp/Fnr family transcriptional regulator [Spirosoma arcticum]
MLRRFTREIDIAIPLIGILFMYDLIVKNVQRKITLTTDEISLFTTLLTSKKLRRRQHLLEAGETCDFMAFISQGLLRSFTTDERGGEHVLQLAPEEFWIGDLYSFLTHQPSQYTLEALEDSNVVLITYDNLETLYARVPAFERFFRLLIQNGYITAQQRLMSTISSLAQERYQEMVRRYPSLEQRVAQHQIASYLGITPESLSRIKKTLYEGQP